MEGFSTNFFQKLFQIHKMWLKLAKIAEYWQQLNDFQTFFGYFHVFQVVEHIPDSFRIIKFRNETLKKKISKKMNFWSLFPILATIYEVKISF
jgi:hypothetical protein